MTELPEKIANDAAMQLGRHGKQKSLAGDWPSPWMSLPLPWKGSKGRYGFSASETWPEAPLATVILNSAGIECFLTHDNMVRMGRFISNLLGGVTLFVNQEMLRQPPPF